MECAKPAYIFIYKERLCDCEHKYENVSKCKQARRTAWPSLDAVRSGVGEEACCKGEVDIGGTRLLELGVDWRDCSS